MSDYEITIRFPSRELMNAFADWLCDGGGEQAFDESLRPKCAVRFQYRPENQEFPPTDRRRYGKWLGDGTIVVHRQKELIP